MTPGDVIGWLMCASLAVMVIAMALCFWKEFRAEAQVKERLALLESRVDAMSKHMREMETDLAISRAVIVPHPPAPKDDVKTTAQGYGMKSEL